MSASVSFPLRYVLPTTAITLSATLRLAVVVDEQGGHLEPEVAVILSVPWRPSALASVRPAGGDTVTGSPLAGVLAASAVPGSLRKAFDRTHPRTAALISDLAARSEQFLAGLRMGEDPADVVTFGRALEIVHRELAAADRMRREWVARQGRDIRSGEWDLAAVDLTPLASPQPTLPGTTEIPEGLATVLARDYGLLVALCADDAEEAHRGGHAVLAVYRRIPDTLPDRPAPDPERPWVLDEALAHVRIADATDAAAGVAVPGAAVPLPRPALDDAATTEAASDIARRQFALLDASDEYARLAATHGRAEELAALEQESRLTSRN